MDYTSPWDVAIKWNIPYTTVDPHITDQVWLNLWQESRNLHWAKSPVPANKLVPVLFPLPHKPMKESKEHVLKKGKFFSTDPLLLTNMSSFRLENV